MSEWRAGSDDEQEGGTAEEEVQLTHSTSSRPRMGKAARARADDDSAYDGGGKAPRAPRAGEIRRPDGPDDVMSVYERVMTFLATTESTLGVVRPVSLPGSSRVGCGLTPDLATQPWAIAGATLHPHQMTGLNWIKSRFEQGINCILADEMGLGKTLQAIAIMAYLYELAHKQAPPPTAASGTKGKKNGAAAGASTAAAAANAPAAANAASAAVTSDDVRVGPFLILCPLTVLDNWSRELESFAPALSVQVYTGSKSEREEIQDDIRSFILTLPKSSRRDPPLPFHVLLATYESAISDAAFLGRFAWRAVVLDESHRVKNADSVLAQTLMHDYQFQWKLLLTGTPVQNNVSELWSLLWFLHPQLFEDKKKFVAEFDILAPATTGAAAAAAAAAAASRSGRDVLSESDRSELHRSTLERLHTLLRPFMLRRLKSECQLHIPPKREVILRTALTPLQRGVYKNILLKNYQLIGAPGAQGNARALVNIVQSLRKCATHSYLFPGVEPEPFQEGPHIYESSGKFALLKKLLAVLHRLGRRVLLFSTSVQSLDLVQDALSFLGYTYERLDGSVRGEERYLAIEKFKSSRETFVFLLSTRAGGVGLNLCCADTVIFLDSDWNPQMDLQAQARAHRIGQKKPVLVVRLLASNTVEEIILKRTQRKLAMTHNVLEKGRFNARHGEEGEDGAATAAGADDPDSIGRSAHDLQNILQYGLDHLFGDGAAAASAEGEGELEEEEIEAIVTGKIDEAKKAAAEAAEATAAASSSAAAAAAAAAAVAPAPAEPSARPSFSRIATHALPSLDDAASLEPLADEADNSVYVYEGTDYKGLREQAAAAAAARRLQLDNVEDELQEGAAKGQQALRAMVAAARASGELDADDSRAAADGDRYASPSADRKRKALVQETDSERAARIARNKEMAQKRLESAQKRREEAEAARVASLKARWAEHGYESRSVQLDEELEAALDASMLGADAAHVAAVPDVAADDASEWGAGDEAEEESKQGGAAAAASSGRPKAQLHYVVGDATYPFVFEREDGLAGKTSQPSQAEPDDVAILSSFDEAAAAANADDGGAAAAAAADSSSCSPSTALLLVPVDASGSWGRGGLFRALDARSSLIGAQYELIGSMEDLAMGDVHVVEIPADQVRPPPLSVTGGVQQEPSLLRVALCVVLKRSKGQSYGAPSLQPDSLALCFRKLASYARTHAPPLSVHLPRLGAQDPNIGWYGIERLLQKHVVSRGVATFVYYFKRQRPQYRSPVKTALSRSHSSFMQRSMSAQAAGGEGQERKGDEDGAGSNGRAAAASASSYAAAASSVVAPARGSSAATPMLLDGPDEEEGAAVPASASAPASAAAAAAVAAPDAAPLSADVQFHDIFTDCLIYLHRGSVAPTDGGGAGGGGHSMSDADARLLSRFLAAYDGDVADEMSARVTHIVTPEPFLTPELLRLKQAASQRVRVVPIAWVEQSVMQGRLDDSQKLQIHAQKA